jgi:hypothetical protein
MTQQKQDAFIDELMNEIQELHEEVDHLKAENRRLGGNGGIGQAIQYRTCINCHRRLPDGPVYFPGYFEEPSIDLTAEAFRHHCIYCRNAGQ